MDIDFRDSRAFGLLGFRFGLVVQVLVNPTLLFLAPPFSRIPFSRLFSKPPTLLTIKKDAESFFYRSPL